MRRVFLLLVLILSVTPSAIVLSAAPAHASCAAPSITVDPTSGAPGQSVVVTGSGFQSCVDTVVCVVGQPCPPQPAPTPMTAIVVRFGQGTTSTVLATVNAAADGSIKTTVKVPSTATAGSATIMAAGTATAPFTVTAVAATVAGNSTAKSVPVRSANRSRTLPATGVAAATNAGFGVALVALGLFLVGVSVPGRRDPRTA